VKNVRKYGSASLTLILACFFSGLVQGSELTTQSIEFFKPLEGRWVREADGIISHLDIDIIKSNRVEIKVESCHETGPARCAKALQTYYLKNENLMAMAGLETVDASVNDLESSRVEIRYREPQDGEDVVHAFELLNESLLSLNSKTVEAHFSRQLSAARSQSLLSK
jgi:hypothetical protein